MINANAALSSSEEATRASSRATKILERAVFTDGKVTTVERDLAREILKKAAGHIDDARAVLDVLDMNPEQG